MTTPNTTRDGFGKGLAAAALVALAGCASASVNENAAPAQVAGPVNGTATLRLETIVSTAEGAIMVALFDDAAAFDGGGAPVRGARIEATGERIVTDFEGLKPGRYALRAFHDQNGDGELNVNPLGLPIEPFAFSAGAKARFGPPSFDKAAIDIAPGVTVETLRFPS